MKPWAQRGAAPTLQWARGLSVLAFVRGVRPQLDLVCCALLTLVLLLLIFVLPGALLPLRSALALVYLLLVPGYLSAAALFPGRGDIDGLERLALSVGLSVAALPFVGLLLNYTPWGIRLHSMSLGLTLFCTLVSLVVLGRRRHLRPAARFYAAQSARALGRNLLLLGLLLGVGAGVVVTAQTLRPPRAVTEFYLLGPTGRLDGLPRVLEPGQAFDVTLGVRHFGQQKAYRIHLPGLDRDLTVPRLADGEVWQKTLTLRAPQGEGQKRLSLELFAPGQLEPYRTLHHYIFLGAREGESVALCPEGQPC